MEKFFHTGRIAPYEKEFFCKDGTRRWFLFAGRDMGDGTICEHCIDITERKRVEQALQAADNGRTNSSRCSVMNCGILSRELPSRWRRMPVL
jgi:hypothetical protein